MAVHRIRLAGPWEFAWQDAKGIPAPERTSGTIKIPCDWKSLFGDVAGKATFARKFHRPTNLEPQEQVAIVFSGVAGSGLIQLNGLSILEFTDVNGRMECDVSRSLVPFNRLEVTLKFDPLTRTAARGGLFDDVAIEIRSGAADSGSTA